MFEPHFPGGFGDTVEEACAEGSFEGGFIEPFGFLPELYALDHFSHRAVL